MNFLEWITFLSFLGFVAWWMWRVHCEEKRRIDAFVDKETRQTQLYERLLEKLEDMDNETA